VLAYVPQVIHTLKIKKADEFSLYFLVILFSGLFFFMVYGLGIASYPLFLESGISCLMTLPMMYYKTKGLIKKTKE
jgi:uncharacterized protein with PQ loop repeat